MGVGVCVCVGGGGGGAPLSGLNRNLLLEAGYGFQWFSGCSVWNRVLQF